MTLDPKLIEELLKEDAEKPKGRGGGRAKADPTVERTINVYFKLPHHFCDPDCEHRKDPNKQSDLKMACWNPNCQDPRDPISDRGRMVVVQVKNQWICRTCYLSGYLK